MRTTQIGTTLFLTLALFSCKGGKHTDPPPPIKPNWHFHGPIAENITGKLGDPIPSATPEQLETFARGFEVGNRRFSPREGLGPAFNVTFCFSCHEKPVFGGSAGMYRNFFLSGRRTIDGAFLPGESAGAAGGVIRLNYVGDEDEIRPIVPDTTTIMAQRNPIPFFGVGLIAELPDDVILANADPDDRDGDGISGRPNYDRGFVGRFGRKSQTVSIEGFIRGPVFNHLGITSDPLTDTQRANLPVDSSGGTQTGYLQQLVDGLSALGQAAAPDGPLTDDDDAPDPEMSSEDLFDLVSFSMLLAAPAPEPATEITDRGRLAFNDARCTDCHTPRLVGPRGPLHVYSDLLIHDMGPELADGLEARDAKGNEFRTQPLWGIVSVGPYLHDGRAKTLDEAIRFHGGEGQISADLYAGQTDQEREDLIAFLVSLGGNDQFTPGLVPPGDPIPPVGDYAGPVRELDSAEQEAFIDGRAAFDTEFGFSDGLGAPRFNGDSCRACHFEPTIGGAGPIGLNVMRHGIQNTSGDFVPPTVGTILHRLRIPDNEGNRPQGEVSVYEGRQTPHLYGLGLVDAIAEADILANADPDDLDADGISGRVGYTDDGRVGRFGWKGSVPSIAEFVRDAITMELGMTLPADDGLTFGKIHDNDEHADPETTPLFAQQVETYLTLLGPPPRKPGDFTAGETLFTDFGCASCHLPSLPGPDGPVPLFSDLLLHEVLPAGSSGIEEASANVREFRTAPLWGLADSGPFLHDGRAETVFEAIEGHHGEASAAREAVQAASAADVAALVSFLESL